MTLQAPFPYFGGKSRVADEVWRRFGDVRNYIEPFFGSGAVLLRAPWPSNRIETVNDADGLVANFWRAVKADPERVAGFADWPVNENDLHARHVWLVGQKESLQERLEGNPDYYDAKIAGWWCWGMCCWIGSGFCSGRGPWKVVDGKLVQGESVRVDDGVWRQLVHLGGDRGVNRQCVHLGNAGRWIQRRPVAAVSGVYDWMEQLADRLRLVRVCCGDWSRVCRPTPTVEHGLTGVFLDPPYSLEAQRAGELYRVDDMSVAHKVREWALSVGDDHRMRVALCGYSGEHDMPSTWAVVRWKARGGYGSHGDGQARLNAARETIWFSPHCLKGKNQQLGLLYKKSNS